MVAFCWCVAVLCCFASGGFAFSFQFYVGKKEEEVVFVVVTVTRAV